MSVRLWRGCRIAAMRQRLNWLADHMVGIIIVTVCVAVAAVLIVAGIMAA